MNMAPASGKTSVPTASSSYSSCQPLLVAERVFSGSVRAARSLLSHEPGIVIGIH
jgi:hypothetical protein